MMKQHTKNQCLLRIQKMKCLEYQYVVGVSFKKALQVYYFGTNDYAL